jgi:hypothetical protein
MPSASRSGARGRLPAHVYRRRRFAVLTVAVLLVLGLGRVLSWSGDGSDDGGDKATQAAADSKPSASASPKKPGKGEKDCKGRSKYRGGDKAKGVRKGCQDSSVAPTVAPTPTPTPPAEPSGPCPDRDVLVTPSVPDPVAGRDVTVVLNLQMGTTEACTWEVSAESVTLKIYAGADDVWSSRECPGAIPTQDVVIRREVATPVTLVWSSKRSDEYCTDRTAWALPGTYGIAAAAFEGEPTDVAFELVAPAAPVVTQAPEPTQEPTQDPTQDPTGAQADGGTPG